MSRQLQVVLIHDRSFLVDTKREILRSVDEPKVIIPFDRILVSNHEVHIAFDRATGKPIPGKISAKDFSDKSIRIETLPQRLVFPPDEIAVEECLPDPMITIYGTIFKLDFNGRRLEEVGRPDNTMLFEDMLLVRNDQLTFWYDQGKKTIFKGSVLELETNADIIKVQILPFFRVQNLTPIKDVAAQTLMEVARSRKAPATVDQGEKPEPETRSKKPRKKNAVITKQINRV